MKRLVGDHLSNVRVYLTNNAFTLTYPDGSFRISEKLLDILTDDEIRSVIGSEKGHLDLDHTAERVMKAYLQAGKTTETLEELTDDDIQMIAEQYAQSVYSLQQEQRSDKFAQQFLMENGYLPTARISALMKISNARDAMPENFTKQVSPNLRAKILYNALEKKVNSDS